MRYICKKCGNEYAISNSRPKGVCQCGESLYIDERFYAHFGYEKFCEEGRYWTFAEILEYNKNLDLRNKEV